MSTRASAVSETTSATVAARTQRAVDVHYTVFIRLPFPRNDFEDPRPVEWNSAKDRQLWKLISKASSSEELDWDAMASRFDVSLAFLLQQAAWVYERHLEGMKAQMKRFGQGMSGASGPVTPPTSLLSRDDSMPEVEVKDTKSPSSLAVAKNILQAQAGTIRYPRPGCSRTPSTRTVTQGRESISVPKAYQHPQSSLGTSYRQSGVPWRSRESYHDEEDSALGHDNPTHSELEDEPSVRPRSQGARWSALNRALSPIAAPGTIGSDGDEEEDDNDSPGDGYLPFAAVVKTAKDDPAATLRNLPGRQLAVPSSGGMLPAPLHGSSLSSTSSAHQPLSSAESNISTKLRTSQSLPRRRAVLERLSPHHQKSGSEESPSMGSSFSDLDDSSLTKSALEDALLSNLHHGGSIGMGSRMSSLRDALGKR